MRRENITAEMIDEYIGMKGYDLPPSSEVLKGIVFDHYFGKTKLEDMIDAFQHKYVRAIESRKRREEKRRIKEECRAKKRERFLKEAYHIYTDGACDNIRTKVGGSGYIILKDGKIIKTKSKGFVKTTNNRMELLAIISAINSLPHGSKAIVYTDSRYCISVLDGDMHAKNQDLINLFLKVSKPMKRIVFEWVKGHNGNKYNEMADELAFGAFKELSEKLGYEVSPRMLITH